MAEHHVVGPGQKAEIDPFKEVVDNDHFEFSESLDWSHYLPNLGGPVNNFGEVLGFQITKFHVLITIAGLIVTFAMIWLGRRMKSGDVPRGSFWNAFEGLYFFVRDKIARAGMGEEGDKYAPFLTTIFLFVLFMNLLGLIPFLGSPTANIAVTLALALVACTVIHVSGIVENGFGGYLKTFIPHFHLEGGSGMKMFGFVLTIGMAILEYATAFIRFAVLAIRLFANMLAGHVALFMILFFITMVSHMHPTDEGKLLYLDLELPGWFYYPVTVFSIVIVTALTMLEIFIAGLQAFIFTLLTSIFIGMAKHPPH